MTCRLSLKMLLAVLLAGLASPVLAHPHVWITATAQVVFDGKGQVSGIRHTWTFDEAYTAYVTQGLDQNNDGRLTSEELQALADENTASLSEFEYFTVLKANGRRQSFDTPREPRMTMDKTQVALSFLLPLKAPVQASGALAMEISDPTLFVYFTLPDGKASVSLANAPEGCVTNVAQAKTLDAEMQKILQDEGVFQTPAGQDIGVQYSNKAIIACP